MYSIITGVLKYNRCVCDSWGPQQFLTSVSSDFSSYSAVYETFVSKCGSCQLDSIRRSLRAKKQTRGHHCIQILNSHGHILFKSNVTLPSGFSSTHVNVQRPKGKDKTKVWMMGTILGFLFSLFVADINIFFPLRFLYKRSISIFAINL